MEVIQDIAALRAQISAWRQDSQTVAFVPTMGNLHGGHFALVERAAELGTKVVVSIFVNPAQFDRQSDLASYPKTFEQDHAALLERNVDLLFAPAVQDVYPYGSLRTKVEVPGISDVLEGEKRSGHFIGVATVVCKLFNLVCPHIAVFGEKDFQQLLLIRQMVGDLDMDVVIEGVQAVRESDGLAMSSRNSYLTAAEREIAPQLHQTMIETAEQVIQLRQQGENEFEHVLQQGMEQLALSGFGPEYLALRSARSLMPATADEQQLVLLVSAWLGKARLIDNLQIDVDSGELR